MSTTLRAVAVASCTALLITAAATAADAKATPAAFTVSPSFGQAGRTVTLTGANFNGETGVTFNGVASLSVDQVSARRLTAVVPSGSTSGTVVVDRVTTPLTGPAFTVQQVTAGTTSLSKTALVFSHSVLVTGHETVPASGAKVVGQSAVLQYRGVGANRWHKARGVKPKTTGKAGAVRWAVQPRANGRYRVHFRESHSFTGLTTGSHKVRVLPKLKLQPLHTATELSTTQIRGSIYPHLTGAVYLQRELKGTWKTVRKGTLSGGHFSFGISPSSLGSLKYRVVRHPDAHHGSSISRALKLQVVHRTLSLGSSGRDVLALQKRLAHLHYDIGARNGNYGTDTLHAVTAFEKVNGLAKDGETGPKVWAALNRPKVPHLKHPDANAALTVEVNIKKQILLLAKHGKVWRILDTSTAGGYQYTGSDGQTETAITPTGHFTIQYKITGWHKSALGEMYYPSYFNDSGYAIHGEGNGNDGSEVPPYPNSHGCVRITNNAVLRYYSMLTVGTSVWIYG